MSEQHDTGEKPVLHFDKRTNFPYKLIDKDVNGEAFEWYLWMARDEVGVYAYEVGMTQYMMQIGLEQALEIQDAGGMSEDFRIEHVVSVSLV
jgi:hypothetical protein